MKSPKQVEGQQGRHGSGCGDDDIGGEHSRQLTASRELSRRGRVLVIAGVALVVLAASVITVWRVLRPAEVVTVATYAYPEAAVPVPGRIGALISAPLILDGRLRIYTTKREIWSDGPPSDRYEASAYWSYRRWPEQVAALALVRHGDDPLVVTSWSDGLLVALHARTGQVAWRVQGDPLATEYPGRRTGADAIYPRAGLLTTRDGFITSHPETLRGYTPDGASAWQRPSPVRPSCRGTEFTTAGQWLVHDTCSGAVKRVDTVTGDDLTDFSMGPAGVEPVSCVSGHSQCQAMRTLGGQPQGWLLTGPEPVASAPLAKRGSVLANGIVAATDIPTAVTAYHPETGQALWTWEAPAPVQLLAAGSDRVFVLLTDRVLAGLDLRSGVNLTRSGIDFPADPITPYSVNVVYTSGRYIVLERINPNVPEHAPDDSYYFTPRPILLSLA